MSEESGQGEYFQSDPTSYQLTGIPCGNPSRYKSRGVIRMDTKDAAPYEDQRFGIPGKKTESEAEQQLKRMVQTQLETNVTLQSQLKKQKCFAPSQIYKPLSSEAAGAKSLQEYRCIQEQKQTIECLQQYGFTDDEIQLKLEQQGLVPKAPKHGRYGANPEAEKERLHLLQKKIDQKEKALSKPDSFSNVSVLSRHALEVERSLHRGTEKANHLSHLVQASAAHVNNDVLEQTLNMSSKFGLKLAPKTSSLDNINATVSNKPFSVQVPGAPSEGTSATVENSINLETGKEGYDNLTVSPDITAIDEDVILNNKLSLEEIKNIPRFKDHNLGEPNRTVYIKNLSPKATEADLVSLFIRYQKNEGPRIVFRLMSGRMRGQAFVTLPNIASATDAVALINGYKLRGKPIILQFGKGRCHTQEQNRNSN